MKVENKEIEMILQKYKISPSLINWKGETIPATKIWYSPEDNRMHSDCGVSIPFIYDTRTQLYKCVNDIIREIIEHYKAKGVLLVA